MTIRTNGLHPWTKCLQQAARSGGWPAFNDEEGCLVTVEKAKGPIHKLSLKEIIKVSELFLKKPGISEGEKNTILKNVKILSEKKSDNCSRKLGLLKESENTKGIFAPILRIVKKIQNYFKKRDIRKEQRIAKKGTALWNNANFDAGTQAQVYRFTALQNLSSYKLDQETMQKQIESCLGQYAKGLGNPSDLAPLSPGILYYFYRDFDETTGEPLSLSYDGKLHEYKSAEDPKVRRQSFNALVDATKEAVKDETEERGKGWLEVIQVLPTQGTSNIAYDTISQSFIDSNLTLDYFYIPEQESKPVTIKIHKIDGKIENVECKHEFVLRLFQRDHSGVKTDLGQIHIEFSLDVGLNKDNKPYIRKVSLNVKPQHA